MSITATCYGFDQVTPKAGSTTTVGALVIVAGPELPNGAVISSMQIDVDFTQTINQIQSAIAAGIRSAVQTEFGQTIPANGVNVIGFSKG